MNQRDILLACLRYCSNFYGDEVQDAHLKGIKLEDLQKTLAEIEVFEAHFGTMSFTTCKHPNGYYYMTFWKKEKHYCPDCKLHSEGWLIRKIKE